MSTGSSTTRRRIDRLITLIDETVNRQVNAVLHHPDFQALEAGWLGLAMLVRVASRSSDVKIRVLSASWAELARSMQRATDFDQSHLFELVYGLEFGMPGGEPFGLLVGNYHLSLRRQNDTIGTLGDVATVAAAAFCPFVAGASPDVIGLENFGELSRVSDLSHLASGPEHVRWNALREREDSRFLGLVAPRILLRPPYIPYARGRNDGFPFHETVAADGSTLLWGNGAFAFAAIVIRSFIDSGWFAEIRGVAQDARDGGLLTSAELLSYDFGVEEHGLSAQAPVEVRLTSAQEQQFCDLGLIPVATTYLSAAAIFNSNQSLHAPQHFSSENARQNARLAAMLQYVLCASRFSHYLKVIMRDEIGQLADAASIQRKLEAWLSNYTLGNDDADLSLRARYPLRSAGIEVREMPGKPGTFSCTLRLQPHFQLDDVSASFHLISETVPLQQTSARTSSTLHGMPV
ncbi:type VI secretion system contractile sheath large subunit [Chelativorans sp. AA-79]|uniref:type VI secretion system contractile sheath large subunit n=1 Tax=Chelativorans sp. AA-79 TaxID=3028735 RepID=UPI0023F6C9C3|nr:type VI secretion system contractile sheath large subunit [Chelativorans sp. AA-79]WEX08239.1 type VI secretion system contractile sheath large subunit [Chelativorans sp. AA-79]